jgi:hypothetical protein
MSGIRSSLHDNTVKQTEQKNGLQQWHAEIVTRIFFGGVVGLEDKFLILSFRDRRYPHCQTTRGASQVAVETRPGFSAPNDPMLSLQVSYTPALVCLLARDIWEIRGKAVGRLMEALKSEQEAYSCAN